MRQSEDLKVHRPTGSRPRSADGALQLFNLTRPSPLRCKPSKACQIVDNFNVFGFRVNPPDPNGEVGPNNYVEMINLVFARVSTRAGNLLVGPVDTGSLWAGFPIEDCTDPSGDPVVLLRPDSWIGGSSPSSLRAA